jgi:hypothetical protein
MGEWTEWFDPADGRVAIQALADNIRADPRADEGAVEELDALARVLARAEAEGVRFRLDMS